ncbi:MAG: hypothetical protein JNL85_17090 [Rubrivivax sp.]|nr:hypothetical protein [Rubrivivax sp.]
MNTKPATSPRWYQRWQRTEGRAAPLDPADLGTCFGMEASLAQEPAPTTPGEETAAVGERSSRSGRSAGRAAWAAWIQRLASRRRPAV